MPSNAPCSLPEAFCPPTLNRLQQGQAWEHPPRFGALHSPPSSGTAHLGSPCLPPTEAFLCSQHMGVPAHPGSKPKHLPASCSLTAREGNAARRLQPTLRGVSPSQLFVTVTSEVLPLGVPKPRGTDAGCEGFSKAPEPGLRCRHGYTADDTRTNTCFACGILGPRRWNKARPLPSWCFIAPSYVCFTLQCRRNSRWHGFSLRRVARSTPSDCASATSRPAKYKHDAAITRSVPAVTTSADTANSPAGGLASGRARTQKGESKQPLPAVTAPLSAFSGFTSRYFPEAPGLRVPGS